MVGLCLHRIHFFFNHVACVHFNLKICPEVSRDPQRVSWFNNLLPVVAPSEDGGTRLEEVEGDAFLDRS